MTVCGRIDRRRQDKTSSSVVAKGRRTAGNGRDTERGSGPSTLPPKYKSGVGFPLNIYIPHTSIHIHIVPIQEYQLRVI